MSRPVDPDHRNTYFRSGQSKNSLAPEKNPGARIKRIAVTGPESTGKSQLSSQLARHYQTVFVPEYARGYIDRLDRPYERNDILMIAKGQLRSEVEMLGHAKNLLICDTELIVIKIWSIHKYGICDPFILRNIGEAAYDLYLLCDIDLPWEHDPQREHPMLREYFFDWYRRELDGYGFPYEVIHGIGPQRLTRAIAAIDRLL